MGRCKRELITWQDSGVDCESIYNQRLTGKTWEDLARQTPVSEATLPRLIHDWANDNGRDALPSRIGQKLITSASDVDRGRVCALYKARWAIKEIAIDCDCTESVVREVISEIN